MGSKSSVIKKLLISSLLGLLIGVITSEGPFVFQRRTVRPPRDIILTIPAGTAQLVARGQQPPSIPTNMSFVVGDRLIVKNEDSVTHKLGPLLIPANSSAQLALSQAESLSYECSFQPGKYFGLDVGEPLTLGIRIFGIIFVAFPMAILFALYYFFLAGPGKEKNVPA